MSKIQKTITPLEKIEDDYYIEKEKVEEKVEDIRRAAIDLFLPVEKRLFYLSKYYELENDAVGELISSIIGMYFFSKTKNLSEYMKRICTLSSLPINYRIECAKNLDNGEGFSYLNDMFYLEKNKLKELPTPVRISTVLFLMDSDDFKEQTLEYFCDIIGDTSIDELYRFRTIQSLENKFGGNLPLRDSKKMEKEKKDGKKEIDRHKFIYFSKEASTRYMKNQRNSFTYRVLACQYLLEKCEPTPEFSLFIEQFLLEVAENPNINDDIRADACDIILQYGSDESRNSARALIFVLGGGDIARNNIFKNAQNVHIRSIEESVEKIIEKLSSYYPQNGKSYDFTKARDEIVAYYSNKYNKEKVKDKLEEKDKEDKEDDKDDKDKKEKEQIEGALTRILIDRAVYGKSHMTLSTILAKVWTYIQDSEFREELEKRLLEELVESNNKCSTGYVSRLVNTLSGFDESMSITISFEDQIIANLEGRLNANIKIIKDEEYMDLVLHEMTIPVIFYNLRLNFLKFFRVHISHIRQEMYEEFRKFMTDTDYDFYFRKAIIHYEGCT
jgi:hypothetical protein